MVKKLQPTWLFLSITFVLSSFFYFLIIRNGGLGIVSGWYIVCLMWCPAVAAFITMKILQRKFCELGWKFGETKYIIQSYLIPFLYTCVAYIIIWVFDWGEFYDRKAVNSLLVPFNLGGMGDVPSLFIFILLVSSIGFIISLVIALGEEIGWRGFLVPELYRQYGFTKTSLFTGVVWVIWHLPILLFAGYNNGTPWWYAIGCFSVLLMSMSFIFTWHRVKAGNLWVVSVLHGSHNLFIQSLFGPITIDTGQTAYYAGEFGIITALAAVSFAIYFWTRKKELPLVI